jgi:THO complex subunit 2
LTLVDFLGQIVEEGKDLSSTDLKKKREKLMATLEKLRAEMNKQEENHQQILKRINSEKDAWILNTGNSLQYCPWLLSIDRVSVTEQFQQMCIFPRVTFSITDAIYCAKFVHLLHKIATPNLSTLSIYDFVRILIILSDLKIDFPTLSTIIDQLL